MSSIKEIKNNFQNKKNLSGGELGKLKLDIQTKKQSTRKKLGTCTNMFNTALGDLSVSLSKNLPNDQTMSIYSGVITNIINDKPNEPISLFLLYVYKNDDYRENILLANDRFFVNSDYSHLSEIDKQNMNLVFQFKNAWKIMKPELQKYVKDSMIMLVKICDQYIALKGDILDLSDMENDF